MNDFVPLLVAIGTTAGGIAAVIRALPMLRRLGLGDSRDCVKAKAQLKADADVWREKYLLEHAERVAVDDRLAIKTTELAAAEANLAFSRQSGAEARQDLDDLRSANRRRRVTRRSVEDSDEIEDGR